MDVPELEFAGSGYYAEPRRGLVEAGPFDLRYGSAHRAEVRIALVGTSEIMKSALQWFERCKRAILADDQRSTNIEYPGFSRIFHSELIVEPTQCVEVSERAINDAMAKKPYEGFKEIVNAFGEAIQRSKRDFHPDIIVCCIPLQIERRFWSVKRPLSPQERLQIRRVADHQEALQIELPFDWEPEEGAEDLLRRDLRRALKAEAMRLEIPIQLVRTNLVLDSRTNEAAAIRAWNSSVGIYYKAGGIPWRIRNRGPETCYVGVTFHHLRTNKRSLVFSSLAQAFSSKGEGFALKGSTLEPDPERRSVHLPREQAVELGQRVLKEYVVRNGDIPKRIVLHKSSTFWEDERVGFQEAFRDVPIIQLVALIPSNLRLVTHAAYPPVRGTLLSVNDCRHYLFTSGFIPELGTYPGPHIPAPIEVACQNDHNFTDVRDAAREILALGRLNWNTSDLRSSQPVTLGFARRVGGIMAEYGLFSTDDPDPSYRYYM